MLSSPRQLLLVGVASVPAAIAGLGFQDAIARTFNSPVMAGYGWLVTAAFLAAGHFAATRPSVAGALPPRSLDQLSFVDALCVGLAQALAILPGVSRSGSTISTGLMRGIDRSAAATFSFLMAVPVIGGAILKVGKDVVDGGVHVGRWDIMLVGIVVSFGVGLVVAPMAAGSFVARRIAGLRGLLHGGGNRDNLLEVERVTRGRGSTPPGALPAPGPRSTAKRAFVPAK